MQEFKLRDLASLDEIASKEDKESERIETKVATSRGDCQIFIAVIIARASHVVFPYGVLRTA